MGLQSQASEAFLQGRAIHTQWESDYLNPDMDRFYDLAFAGIVARAGIKPTDRILDAGCGYCFHTQRLAKSGAHITAVDFSTAALAEAAKNVGGNAQITLRQGDLTNLPFSAESFDHVVCWGVLMHIPELEKALSELSRVLKVGGALILSETNMRSPDIAIRERALRGLKSLLGRGKSDVRRTDRGLEVWTNNYTGGLMVRKTDMAWLRSHMSERGMTQTAKVAGQLTEAYTNFPLPLKRVTYAINAFYHRRSLPASIAASNIIYFRKTAQPSRP